MESVRKKAGYLEGLMQAMKLGEDDMPSQLTRGMVELLSQLSDRVEALDDMIAELNDYVESIDNDLCDLEGMQDNEDLGDDDMDFPDESPLRLIKTEAAAPEKLWLAARCPKCSSVFLAAGPLATEKYVCPLCQKKIKPERLNDKNTPVAEPVK